MPRKLTREQMANLVPGILEASFWLSEVEGEKTYARLHNDHDGTGDGTLEVFLARDGDAVVSISSGDDALSLRFRTGITGGGVSPRTRRALMILALAMKLDEKEYPQKEYGAGR